MTSVYINVPDIHIHQVKALKAVPFAKTDRGYQFADWVYELNKKETDQEMLLSSPHGQAAALLVEKAKEDLKNVVISEEDYAQWAVYRKESASIALYHKILNDLNISLFLLSVSVNMEDVKNDSHKTERSIYEGYHGSGSSKKKTILNRNNPFADISIKSQQFFYKTEDGSVETLCFDTNSIIEKADRNGKNMFTMRPSFQISKERGIIKKSVQRVTFASSITEPIAEDDTHIYVHIG